MCKSRICLTTLQELTNNPRLGYGCKHGKVDQKVLWYTKTIMFLVKGLKVVAKRYLNRNYVFIMTFIVVLNTQM